ncbi:MAG: MBOAT family protein [Deltaproteobacteria bacterium]|nr:MBOAT family protein [Deltaproteobacteria bacterium]
MLFSTYTFVYFLFLVVLVRWALPRLAVPWLLFASYVFYLSWDPRYGVLLLGATAGSWLLGLAMERAPRLRRLWVTLGVVTSLLLLGFFKYAQFTLDTLWSLGLPGASPVLGIVLPLGISFFTFQALSYVVDVYRGAPAVRSPVAYALYISFFPQLIAGPIVRANELVPQLLERQPFRPGQFASGVDLLLRGLLKKVVLADRFAMVSDLVFADPTGHSAAMTALGVLCYAGQIYCDFSAYTDIARGAGRMLGFELPENFRLPYLSASPTEFWRRWHITLSRWLRDYLYIPLGGNRHGEGRRMLNLVITMALGGLWHGASFTFVVWGLLHGFALLLHRAWVRLTRGSSIEDLARRGDAVEVSVARSRLVFIGLYRALATLLTFAFVCFAWVFFRSPDFASALGLLGQLLRGGTALVQPEGGLRLVSVALIALGAAHLLGLSPRPAALWRRLSARRAFAPLRGLVWALAVLACYLLSARPSSFIYFQF